MKHKLIGICIFIAVIWGVFLLDQILPLEQMALRPRQLSGLLGIVASPFLHLNLSHIIANSSALFVLLIMLCMSRDRSVHLVCYLILVGGILHWILGRSVPVIGASGLVFGLIGYLIFSGVFSKTLVMIGVSILVMFLYGGSILSGILPTQAGVSWDGHLFGFIGGIIVAWLEAKMANHRIAK